MKQSLFKQLILDQRKIFLKPDNDIIIRDTKEKYSDLIKLKHVIAITGVRRAGKSYFLKLLASHLIKEKRIEKNRIFYINFENENFVDFKIEDYNLLLKAYFEVSGKLRPREKVYCFFDEIQNVKYWEKWINGLYERGDFKIFITGSNSSLLTSEFATSLTGRNYPIEIFPYSFKEYLRAHRIDVDLEQITSEEEGEIRRMFDKYLLSGGFPETINNPIDILDNNYKSIIYKDIIARFGIKNIKEFRELAHYLVSNIGGLMSYRNIARMIEDINSSVTAKNYIGYLNDAYLLFPVKKLETSVRKQNVNPFKIYSIDNGLSKSVSFSISENYSKLYENLTFLGLRRQRDAEIFYYKNNFEADFIAMKKGRVQAVIQACYDAGDKNTKIREERGLLEALQLLDQKEGYIINNYIEATKQAQSKKIHFIPLWKWLLQK